MLVAWILVVMNVAVCVTLVLLFIQHKELVLRSIEGGVPPMPDEREEVTEGREVREEEEEPSYDEEDLTQSEIERIRRKKEFDMRIRKLKEELDNGYVQQAPKGTIASELHPLVKNLPHDSQPNYSLENEVEYAD